MTRTPSAPLSMLTATLLLALGAGAAHAADTTVQVPLNGLLDGRSVTTVTAGGQLVIFTLTTDGGGSDDGTVGQNAFATDAVAKLKNAPAGHTLPDDGRFPADARHPDVVLHFSNAADATSPQTHLLLHSGTISFPMPPASYSKLFLFFSGANGGTTVKTTLTYADTTTEILNATVPDYYADVSATDPVIFNLAPDLAKWSKTTMIAEASHHHITGVELHPTMATKTLTGVRIDRGASGFLLFWGATGVATSDVAGLPDAGAPTDGGGGTSPVDASGGAGASGAGGAAGAGGTAGTAGATGGAGGQTTTGTAGVGAAGTSGAAGAGTAGTSGAAGSTSSTGAAGAPVIHTSPKSSGCSLAVDADAPRSPAPLFLVLGAGAASCLGRRRRR